MRFQQSLFDKPILVGDIYDEIGFLLETFPETQERYMELYLRYWEQFQGLREIIETGDWGTFERFWLYKAKNPKTLLQRCQEVQNRRRELEPKEIWQKRREQGRQGIVK